MPAGRSLKSLVDRRRRVGGESDDDGDNGSFLNEDSRSEGSVLTQDDATGPQHGASENPPDSAVSDLPKPKRARGPRKKGKKGVEKGADGVGESGSVEAGLDTSAVTNGRHPIIVGTNGNIPSDNENLNGVAANGAAPVVAAASKSVPEQQEQRKRDSNPAIVPNRGSFFMHDNRNQFSGHMGQHMRGQWARRGRGRGAFSSGGPFPHAHQTSRADQAAQQPWKHDLHDTINAETTPAPFQDRQYGHEGHMSQAVSARTVANPVPPAKTTAVLSFSSTTVVGKIQIRVALPGARAPIVFPDVAWKRYVRLPIHRPPLRRDKPVRISIPPHTQRYIFPSSERSFVFIPRQMRPNQRGYGTSAYARSVGGYGYSSRRTSMYGESMVSMSVAASRRSSITGMSRADAFSPIPVGNAFAPANSNYPVVRLPHGPTPVSRPMVPSTSSQGPQPPNIGTLQIHTYPLPQQPTFQGTPTTTVHQPRPQKAISVTGIETPAALRQAPSGSEPLPFQSQLPPSANDYDQTPFSSQVGAAYYSPRLPYHYPHQPQASTPLSGIPEQSMHNVPYYSTQAQYRQPQYYPNYASQQNYYYSPPGPSGYAPMPMYMPPPPGYMMPPPAHAPQVAHQPPMMHQPPQLQQQQQQHHRHNSNEGRQASHRSRRQNSTTQSQSGMLAHESNGMVFYLPASEAEQRPEADNYQPAEGFVPAYALPGLPPTPAPETTYYQYPPAPISGYYPPQT